MPAEQDLTLNDLSILAERCDLECKAAQGRDGRGELPADFWKSYSAMANGEGGLIWLGVQEKPLGHFQAVGLIDVERVRKALWDNLHNPKQVSANLLAEHQVQPVRVDGKTVLRIEVPRASRQVKPVHLGSNPFGGTYLRRHEGDYPADEETVRRMLAERVEDARDARVLKGFDIADLDMDSVLAYRNRFAAVKPGHVWADLSVPDFLERIGAVGRDREQGYSGLRLAGLLMFGRAEVIREALPNYMVDYQERPEAKAERRWIDRLVPDGSWSGNVYDFFRRVYQRLTADLKVPFQLLDAQRVEDTPVHEALREALVNTLIHADFSGRVSVLVVKRPDMFGFRNPGLMRVPPELALVGGNSDCRNRRLQTMFQLVGYGDHAGSGIPKIYSNWAGQHWRRPVLQQVMEPEQTLMELRMSSLLPPETVAKLESSLGERFSVLAPQERLALVTVATEGQINHSRLREISADHPTDITKMLARLVRDGLLVSEGIGRGMVYHLPGQAFAVQRLFDVPDEDVAVPLTPELGGSGPEAPRLTPELAPGTGFSPPLTPELAADGATAPLIADLGQLSEEDLAVLKETAAPASSRKRVDPDLMRETVLALCRGRYLGLRVLASLLNRRDKDGSDLRKRILNPLVQEGQLTRAFPSPSDPRQAYLTSPKE
ncbi:RNA-binding domain-containing protein [Paucibacter sp. XJ19-41]|uniref:RNA-binding domain-containing protein n=1 Tax=Paucibacter sp. XJ19-41 TaxID=2927824 RepID=UPI0023495055|nr:RNA-binding domain-containing protein [Paucibacter sp. XJ19-41]MDC6166992.1 putative DNA binding domain-containing protein [Paucibacter sp. XJ19-41]